MSVEESPRKLPDHPSLEYLRKLAKQRLRELQGGKPEARLSEAQLVVAREHGFPSWRVMKAEVERRSSAAAEAFFSACAAGDAAALRALLDLEPGLVRERRDGTTGLH